MHKLDLSQEMLIQPTRGGIQLVRPDKKTNQAMPRFSLQEFLALPFNTCLLDTESNIVDFNQQEMMTFEHIFRSYYLSKREILGKNISELCHQGIAEPILRNVKTILRDREMHIFEERLFKKEEMTLDFISFKMPWYDQDYNILGIFVCCLLTDNHYFSSTPHLATTLQLMVNTGLLSATRQMNTLHSLTPGKMIEGVYLSTQELKCLHLSIRGMTAKMIAKDMQLSPRTVEDHLNSLKLKLKVSNRPELIDKAIYSIFPEVHQILKT